MFDPSLAPPLPGGASAPLRVLSLALEQRDAYTEGHCNRVCRLAFLLGQRFDLDAVRLGHLALAARFHDAGKIGVRDEVLLHPGQLDAPAREDMRMHAVFGERLFLATGREDAADVARLIRHHHEAFDGSGYPDGLAGEAIPLEVRILSVADGYDAMTSARPYRGAMPSKRAMETLAGERGQRIDPEVYRQLQAVLRAGPDI